MRVQSGLVLFSLALHVQERRSILMTPKPISLLIETQLVHVRDSSSQLRCIALHCVVAQPPPCSSCHKIIRIAV